MQVQYYIRAPALALHLTFLLRLFPGDCGPLASVGALVLQVVRQHLQVQRVEGNLCQLTATTVGS